jgi:A/G-specific adenine glycosylase
VLISEVMLQQTQAARVVPIFERFVRRFPSLASLAAAPRSDVVEAWAGLGYNRRAVALSSAARRIVEDHEGLVPSDPRVLASLPGVGPYTAAAVASIAYGARIPAIDTNVRRVVRRALLGRDEADPGEVEALADRWIDPDRPGAWNESVMDLGRTFCRSLPRCDGCPLGDECAFALAGAVPRRPGRGQGEFVGSMRQVRGDVVRVLRASSSTIAGLAAQTGHASERLAEAVAGLVSDGLVDASPAALRGLRRGRVSLAR